MALDILATTHDHPILNLADSLPVIYLPPARKKEPITAIIKPTLACNLKCIYCYEGDNPNNRMNIVTAKNLMKNLAEYHGKLNPIKIIWHGGEPLLMGIDFYEEIVAYQKELGNDFIFKNNIQTNGTLLSKEFVDFFAKNDFDIGLSLDGPEWLHNLQRPTKNGKNSYDLVMNNIAQLKQRNDVNNTARRKYGHGVISVLTRHTLQHLAELYQFCKTNEINLKLNPIFYSGRAKGKEKELGITAKEYAKGMIELFDIWFHDTKPSITINPLSMMIGNLITNFPHGCQFGGECYKKFVSINPNGDTYPCGRWPSESEYLTGNINNLKFEQIMNAPSLKAFHNAREIAVKKCQNCEFIKICNGGCIDNSYIKHNDLTDIDYYCEGYKSLLSHIKYSLKSVLPKPTQRLEEGTTISVFGEHILYEEITHPIVASIIRRRVLEKYETFGYPKSGHSQYVEYSDSYTEHVRTSWNDYDDYDDYHCD